MLHSFRIKLYFKETFMKWFTKACVLLHNKYRMHQTSYHSDTTLYILRLSNKSTQAGIQFYFCSLERWPYYIRTTVTMAINNPITVIVHLIRVMHAALRGPKKARKDYKTVQKETERKNKGLEQGWMNGIMRKREMSPLRLEGERERVGLIWRHAEQGN